jgi:hypothetical protein
MNSSKQAGMSKKTVVALLVGLVFVSGSLQAVFLAIGLVTSLGQT